MWPQRIFPSPHPIPHHLLMLERKYIPWGSVAYPRWSPQSERGSERRPGRAFLYFAFYCLNYVFENNNQNPTKGGGLPFIIEPIISSSALLLFAIYAHGQYLARRWMVRVRVSGKLVWLPSVRSSLVFSPCLCLLGTGTAGGRYITLGDYS